MKNITFGIVIGIFIGYEIARYQNISSNLSNNQNRTENKNHIPNILEHTKVKNEHSIQDDVNLVESKPIINEMLLKKNHFIEKDTREQDLELHQVLNFDFSEDQILELEINLNELQNQVSFFRDNQGWTVQYYDEPNLLSDIGIKNNDFIPFDDIQKLKEDPYKGKLISRLESIMESLQR